MTALCFSMVPEGRGHTRALVPNPCRNELNVLSQHLTTLLPTHYGSVLTTQYTSSANGSDGTRRLLSLGSLAH